MKSGFIALIGRPNSGKSTLMNALVGEKVSIVSWRPQTTRNKIIGIMNGDDYQIAFIDTPGIHTPKTVLGKYMMKTVRAATDQIDAIIYVVDAGRTIDTRDIELVEKHIANGTNVVAVLNKIDEVTQEKVFYGLSKLNEIKGFCAIIPTSAVKGKNIDVVREEILKIMPEGIKYYPDDMITDRSERFMVAEMLREKALRYLSDEIPHGIGIEITKFSYRSGAKIVDICADIICEKESHKGIIIGKAGAMLKKIVTSARADMQKLVGTQVFLQVFVKVKGDWRDSEFMLKELGYDNKNID